MVTRSPRTRAHPLLPIVALAIAHACSPTPQSEHADGATESSGMSPEPPGPDPLAIDYAPQNFTSSPTLPRKLARSPFRYFRYINAPFMGVVCRRFAADKAAMTSVNLHGDAHLEQYAVAEDGRGLADFDAASTGPPVVDWVRFSTSLWLASKGDHGAATGAIHAFVQGYRAALADPSAVGSEPSVAARIRAGFESSPLPWLDGVERLILPLDTEGRMYMEGARKQYVGELLRQNPDLTAAFFAVKKGGSLEMGIGSAHDEKFLARVEGPTASPADDVILETKEVVAMTNVGCVAETHDARRVVLGQARLANSPQRFLGTASIAPKVFYVHAWRVHYTEVDVDDIRSPAELAELAYDVGLQLGRGHPNQIADPLGSVLRRDLDEAIARLEPSLLELSRELADRVNDGWKRFRERACADGIVDC